MFLADLVDLAPHVDECRLTVDETPVQDSH